MKLSIRKGVEIDLRLEEQLPDILADSAQIQQVVMNLVINASEAIAGGEGTISITTSKVHAQRCDLLAAYTNPDLPEGDYVLLDVSDTGCGMDLKTLSTIFDPFFTTKFTGRGLGLAAVLGIVKGHHAALKVDSQPGHGTTFKIYFPCSRNIEPGKTPPAPSKQTDEKWSGSGAVLVVDDEEAVRSAAELLFPALGFDVLLAKDGFEACKILKEGSARVVAVLLDLTMPRMDGVKTLHELRMIRPDLKVIVMSGYDEKEAIDRFTNEGFDHFLQKPFTRDQLIAKLKTVLKAAA
jgi:CheY-like chemotaxis protein